MPGRKRQGGVALVELVVVVAIALIVSGMAVPQFVSMRRNYRTLGEARNIHSIILLAKMRAAASFTRARVKFDRNARTFELQVWDRTGNAWVREGAANSLAPQVNFGVASLTAPPPGTQSTLAQAPGCVDGLGGDPGGGTPDATTACITFNSRGIPVNNLANPFPNGAIYITDTVSVYGSTVSITGQTIAWRSEPNSAVWVKR